jgi:hypothetical protein
MIRRVCFTLMFVVQPASGWRIYEPPIGNNFGDPSAIIDKPDPFEPPKTIQRPGPI